MKRFVEVPLDDGDFVRNLQLWWNPGVIHIQWFVEDK